MFENEQFFSHLHLKYAKSAIMAQKLFFLFKHFAKSKKLFFCSYRIYHIREAQKHADPADPDPNTDRQHRVHRTDSNSHPEVSYILPSRKR
jgi:hypothetical protein